LLRRSSGYLHAVPSIHKILKHTQITSHDNVEILISGNKNLHAENTNSNIISRNLEIREVSPDRRYNSLVNVKRNINGAKEKQMYTLSKSFAAVTNNTNLTMNNDISELNELMSEIQKLKQLVDIPQTIIVIRNLNNKLVNCKDSMEKLQAFIEAAEP